MSDDEQFEAAGADSAQSVPKQASALRKNGHVLIKGQPCKIVDMSTSKTGKHGHAKIHFVGIQLFTGKKYEDICPSTHNMQEPIFKRYEKTVISLEDDKFFVLMNDTGDCDSSIKLTDECDQTEKEIRALLEKSSDEQECIATVFECMGKQCVKKVELKKQS